MLKGTLCLGKEAAIIEDQVSYRPSAQTLDMGFHNVCSGVYNTKLKGHPIPYILN